MAAGGRPRPAELRELAKKHVGLMAYFVKFEPEGLEIVINSTTIEVPAGTEVSLTMRMREIAPPPSGMPRREYPPPSAVRMAWTRSGASSRPS